MTQPSPASKVECNACPVLCHITLGRAGACDRYANQDGILVRLDPVVLLRREAHVLGSESSELQPREPLVGPRDEDLDGNLGAHSPGSDERGVFVTGVGAYTTYPDYKPAPFIVASRSREVDLITVVTEGIFSYCSLKVKIDTDRYLGPEQAAVRCRGEVVGHVTTAEYGSQMLSLGGVHHPTGGSKKEGRVTVELMEALGNQQPQEVSIDGGSTVVLQAGRAPTVDAKREERMRVGLGPARIAILR